MTGGVAYRGAALPEWQEQHLFGDDANGRIFRWLALAALRSLAATTGLRG